MVKSTPINQLQPEQPVVSPPQTEEINMEDLIQEKQVQDHTTELQHQIDSLKQQIELTKVIPQNVPTPPESIISKNALINMLNDFDYKLFFVIITSYLLLNSSMVYSYIFDKLEMKELGYLTTYIQSILLGLIVVLVNKN